MWTIVHIFICFGTIWLPFPGKWLFTSLASCFSIGLLVFVTLIYSSSLYIWDSRLWSVIWIANIFFFSLSFISDFAYCYFVLYLLVCRIFFFGVEFFSYFLNGFGFWIKVLKKLFTLMLPQNSSWLLLKNVLFYILHLSLWSIGNGGRYGSNCFLNWLNSISYIYRRTIYKELYVG